MAGKRGGGLYDWPTWFGRPHTVLVRGRDYHCSQAMMWQQVRNAARRYRVRIQLIDGNDHLTIKILDDNNKATHPDKITVAT